MIYRNGHLAVACAIDGHNWMFPVAFGFIDGEKNKQLDLVYNSIA